MATQDIPKLKETFADNKEPNGQDFANLIDSFDHKSAPIAQTRILGLKQSLDEKATIEQLEAVSNDIDRQDAVDTYNDASGGETSLLGTYPNPTKGYDVLVMKDEHKYPNDPKPNRYNWNGKKWIDMMSGVYDENVVTKNDLADEVVDEEKTVPKNSAVYKGLATKANTKDIFSNIEIGSETEYLNKVSLDVQNILHAPLGYCFWNQDAVKESGFVSTVSLNSPTKGTLFVIVMRPNATGVSKEDSRRAIEVEQGINVLSNINLPVLVGDYVGIASNSIGVPYIASKPTSPYFSDNSEKNTDISKPFAQAKSNPTKINLIIYQFTISDSENNTPISFTPSFSTAVKGVTEPEVKKKLNTSEVFDENFSVGVIKQLEYIDLGITNFLHTSPKYYCWWNVETVKYDGRITVFRLPSKSVGTLNIVVMRATSGAGELRVEVSRTPINVKVGLNELVVDIEVKKGDYVGLGCTDSLGVPYRVVNNPSYQYYADNADKNNSVNDPFKQTISSKSNLNEMLYNYDVISETIIKKEFTKEFKELIKEVSPNHQSGLVLTSPSGTKFEIIVDDNGVLSTQIAKGKKWVVIGNSISWHPINSYWWGEYGMAASKRENDFVHVLNEMIGGSFTVAWGVEWERNHPTYDLAYFDEFFDGDEDFVVFRIGENVSILNSFNANFTTLIAYIKQLAPHAKIIVTGMFMGANGNSAQKDTIIAQVANSTNSIHVPLLHLDTPDNQNKIGNQVMGDDGQLHTIDNGAVALHPNDKGMKAIADAIFEVI